MNIPPLLKRRPRVTIAIGFACQNSIVVGSDSQMSESPGTFQSLNERKVVEIRFRDGSAALLAKSGSIGVGNAYQSALEDAAAKAVPQSARSIADIAAEVLKTTRDELLTAYHHKTFEPDSSQRYLASIYSNFLLAYYHNGKPNLYTLELDSAYAFPCKGEFEAIGCGASVARLLLSDLNFKEKKLGESFGLAFYAIEMCKKYDQGCGGPIQLKALTPDHRIEVMPSDLSEDGAQAALRADAEMKAALPDKWTDAFVKTVANRKMGDNFRI